MHNNAAGNNSVVTYGNNVTINSSLPGAFIDINNNGADTGNTLVLGTLGFTGFTAGNPAPSTILNITGGNNYKLQFTGTTLTGATTAATLDIGAGLSLILPGGFTIGTNLPTNIGPGTLVLSGSNTGTIGSPLSGVTQIAPAIGQTSTPLGTGAVTLSNGATLQIAPVYSSAITTAGYNVGAGLSQKFKATGNTTIAAATNFGLAPSETLAGILPKDSNWRISNLNVNGATASTSLGVYSGLLLDIHERRCLCLWQRFG